MDKLQLTYVCTQACSVCRWLEIHQDYFCRVYFSQLETFLLNDALLICPVVSEMCVLGHSPVLAGQTTITTLG